MFRKVLVGLVLLSMLTGVLFAAELVKLRPLGYPKGPVVSSELDDYTDNALLRRYTGDAEYYLGSGSAGDTMAVAFQPLVACSIYAAQIQWFSGGSYQAYMWEFNEEASANGRAPERGTSEISPLGDVMFGPFVNTAEGTQEWEALFTNEDIPNGGIEWDTSPIIIGYVKTQDDGLPQPLADDVSSRGFTYTWFGGPWTSEDYDFIWGSYSSDYTGTIVDIMMHAYVAYTENPPPFILTMDQLPNTVNPEKVCTVWAEIEDDNGWSTDEAMLYVKLNDGTPEAFEMTDDDEDGMFMAEFSLADLGAAAGDQVSYWIETEDDQGASNANSDDGIFFNVVELANPDAELLFVDAAMTDRLEIVEAYFAGHGVSYEYWSVSDNKGLDMYTVNGGNWNTVFVGGWGTNVPTRAWDDSPYYDFIMNGGNFILNDMDYFYTNGEEAGEITFAEGDFAFDVFGIEAGTNDPEPTDSLFLGEVDDPISGAFADESYETYPEVYSGNWADFVVPNDEAVGVFLGEELGNYQAIRKEVDGQKTVYFAFDIFSAAYTTWGGLYRATEQQQMLLESLLGYVDVTVGVDEEGSSVLPNEFALEQNFPNPFNPSTTINFSVPQRADVTLTVYNVAGQEVMSHTGSYGVGQHNIHLDASDLASGIYMYRLEAADFSATRKMMLMK
ncbi:T9SS type A sorting domain-containing protein [bacterium]|nr:T9SS type A sorting domain-containing protein [bacterium]